MFDKARRNNHLLYDWMRANHDDLQAELGTGRIVWRSAMQVIEELGLVDANGNSPTRDTAFRTWRRVQSDLAAAGALKRSPSLAVTAPGEIAPGVLALPARTSNAEMATSGPPAEAAPRMRLAIRPARALSSAPNPSGASHLNNAVNTASAAETKPCHDAAEQIQRVLDTIGAARVPMPKKVS